MYLVLKQTFKQFPLSVISSSAKIQNACVYFIKVYITVQYMSLWKSDADRQLLSFLSLVMLSCFSDVGKYQKLNNNFVKPKCGILTAK